MSWWDRAKANLDDAATPSFSLSPPRGVAAWGIRIGVLAAFSWAAFGLTNSWWSAALAYPLLALGWSMSGLGRWAQPPKQRAGEHHVVLDAVAPDNARAIRVLRRFLDLSRREALTLAATAPCDVGPGLVREQATIAAACLQAAGASAHVDHRPQDLSWDTPASDRSSG